METLKYNKNKIRLELLPTEPLEKIAETYQHGTSKYIEENWREGRSWKSLIGAILRHLYAFKRGEDIVPDQGTLHLAAAAWGCITLIYYLIHNKGTDDRIKNPNIDKIFMIEPGNKEQLKQQKNLFLNICDKFEKAKLNGQDLNNQEIIEIILKDTYE